MLSSKSKISDVANLAVGIKGGGEIDNPLREWWHRAF
jgi:hypothetical protein